MHFHFNAFIDQYEFSKGNTEEIRKKTRITECLLTIRLVGHLNQLVNKKNDRKNVLNIWILQIK